MRSTRLKQAGIRFKIKTNFVAIVISNVPSLKLVMSGSITVGPTSRAITHPWVEFSPLLRFRRSTGLFKAAYFGGRRYGSGWNLRGKVVLGLYPK